MQEKPAQSILARFTRALLEAHATVVTTSRSCGPIEGDSPGFQLRRAILAV